MRTVAAGLVLLFLVAGCASPRAPVHLDARSRSIIPDGWLQADPAAFNDSKTVELARADPSMPECQGTLQPCWDYPVNVSIAQDQNWTLYPMLGRVYLSWSDVNGNFSLSVRKVGGGTVPLQEMLSRPAYRWWMFEIDKVGAYVVQVKAEKAVRDRIDIHYWSEPDYGKILPVGGATG